MRHFPRIAALLTAAGLSATALAQDSVSNNGGDLPGDALIPWSEACAAYVIDLAPITTSMGHVFGIAPVLKASKMNTANFTALGSSAAISPDLAPNTAYSRASYTVWNNPGAGVNETQNNPGQTVMPTGPSSRFALAFGEFGTTDAGFNYNGILGAIVNFDPANPNRLFVDRRVAAVNMPNAITVHSSQLGGVTVDAGGNIYFRGDGFGGAGNSPLVDDNIFRTRLADRACLTTNLISAAATLDATNRIIIANPTAHSVAENIPASIAGGNGVYAGPNFDSEYVFGPSLGSITATTGHLDPTTTSVDQRGSFGSSLHTPLGGDYTFGVLGQGIVTGNSTVINLWGVNANGSVVANKGYEVPLTITDHDDGFSLTYLQDTYQDAHHYGVSAFRGGVGHVALGADSQGRTLIAMVMSENGFAGDFANQIVVGRFDDPNGPVEWTFAAYVDQFQAGTLDAGKPIFDELGNEIGQLVDLIAVTGGSPLGPSMSAPAIDSAGNIWFLGAVELYDRLMGGGSDFDGALLRAIYNPDTFSYRLELVLEVGTIVTGPNSNREYRIDFLGTATGSNTAAPNAVWSSSVADGAWNNASATGMEPSDPKTLGGAVISTSITYDVDGDGEFNNPTSAAFDPGLPPDEAYQVALYVGYYQQDTPPCPADLAPPFGVLNFFDVSAFLSAYNSQDPIADFAAPFGVFNFFDVSAFLSAYNAGCP